MPARLHRRLNASASAVAANRANIDLKNRRMSTHHYRQYHHPKLRLTRNA